MSRRTQLLAGTLALCLALLAGGWFLLAQPRKQEVADLRTQVESQRSTNASLQTQVASLQDIQRRLPAEQAKVADLTSRVPSDPQIVALIRQLSQAATDSNVTLAGLTPTRPSALAGAPGLSGVQLSLTVNGSYPSLEQFQLALEGLQRSFLVTQVTLAEGGASSAGAGAVASSGGITATIVGRVLTGTAGAGATKPGTTTS